MEEKGREDKKMIARLGQTNKKLFSSVKDSQSTSTEAQKPPSSDSTRRLSGEIHRLHLVNTALTKRLDESETDLKQKEEELSFLFACCKEFEERTRVLGEMNRRLSAHLGRVLKVE